MNPIKQSITEYPYDASFTPFVFASIGNNDGDIPNPNYTYSSFTYSVTFKIDYST